MCERHAIGDYIEPPRSDNLRDRRPRNAALIASYGPMLEEPGYDGGEWIASERLEDGSTTFPGFVVDDGMASFIKACDASGWHRLPYDQWTAGLVNEANSEDLDLSTTSLLDLGRMVTFIDRSEHHSPGAYVHAVRCGLLAKVARRASEIALKPLTDHPPRAERLAGAMLGGAVGDAIGACTKRMTISMIRELHGPGGITTPGSHHGRVGAITSLTQMALFTAEGLVRACDDDVPCQRELRTTLHAAYLTWLATQQRRPTNVAVNWEWTGDLIDHQTLGERRWPGKTAVASLLAATALGEPFPARNQERGCTCVSRGGPVGLMAEAIGDMDEVFDVGATAAGLTHGHPVARLATGCFAVMVAKVCQGQRLPWAVEAADAELARRHGSMPIRILLERAVAMAKLDRLTPEDLHSLGKGYDAGEALAIGVCCALAAKDFRSAVTLAANHSGDSNTTAVIAGMLFGCSTGTNGIPVEFLVDLEIKEEIAWSASLMENAISESLKRAVPGDGHAEFPNSMAEEDDPTNGYGRKSVSEDDVIDAVNNLLMTAKS